MVWWNKSCNVKPFWDLKNICLQGWYSYGFSTILYDKQFLRPRCSVSFSLAREIKLRYVKSKCACFFCSEYAGGLFYWCLTSKGAIGTMGRKTWNFDRDSNSGTLNTKPLRYIVNTPRIFKIFISYSALYLSNFYFPVRMDPYTFQSPSLRSIIRVSVIRDCKSMHQALCRLLSSQNLNNIPVQKFMVILLLFVLLFINNQSHNTVYKSCDM